MPKLSVCIPTYRKPELIREAINNLEEILEWIDYEILVFNDDHLDIETNNILKAAQKINPRIRYETTKDNVWVTKAWNWLAENAKGEYISIINNDVIFPEGFYHTILEAIENETNPDVVMYNPRFTEEDDYETIMYYTNHLCGHCFTFRAKDLNKLFPIDERFHIFWNDNWLWHHIDDQWLKQRVIHNAICHHLKSQTVKDIPNKDRKIYLDMCQEMSREVPEVYPLPTDDLEHNLVF